MVNHTKTIRRPLVTIPLSVFDHIVVLALKGLTQIKPSLFFDKNFFFLFTMFM